MSDPKEAVATFIEGIGVGAVYETSDGSRYRITTYVPGKAYGVEVRLVEFTGVERATFLVSLETLLAEARDGLIWIAEPAKREGSQLARDAALHRRCASASVGEIRAERARQDQKWGGAAHDDRHAGAEWRRFIAEHAEKGDLVAVAALGFAVTEVLDRLRARVGQAENVLRGRFGE